MKSLSIDLETFSDVDLNKSGVYRYTESTAFEILLFGFARDDDPVTVLDLTAGDTVPEDVLDALTDETVTKWAFNANFERICLSAYLKKYYPERFATYSIPEDSVRNYLDPASWRCSMIWSAYLGLPLSLKGVGEALDLEEQKMAEGRELLRYFCTPCKPTKANGGRTRNLPSDAPNKWEVFKKYNRRDVEVEMSIKKRLRNFPVPESVWDEYHIDQEINDRGILVDLEMAEQAIAIDSHSRASLTEKLQKLTGLSNPNSVVQMKDWLSAHGLETDTLGKKAVASLLETAPDDLKEVLKLRQQIAKSSVKKYQAMQNAACRDHRARGMFQFYGANRSGRFSGRLIQLQNLPQNHMPDLAEARALVKNGDYESLDLLYDSVPNVLSELIRTAFIPRPGMKFIVSDFSSIEARVLAYLSGEQHTMDSFAKGEDIYCATASAMFHKPVVKHGINGELRQKGKIATLACIAEGQPVLTNHGLIPIEKVTTEDLIWDGEQFVKHDGVVYRGRKEVITYEGLTATPDHLVWICGESRPVRFEDAAACGAHLLKTGDGRNPVRLGKDHISGEKMVRKMESLLRSDPMYGMRFGSVAGSEQSADREIERLSALLTAKADTEMVGSETDSCQAAMHESTRSGICELWCKGYPVLLLLCSGSGSVSHQYLRSSASYLGYRQDRHEWGLRAGESSLCDTLRELLESAQDRSDEIRTGLLAILLSSCDPETFVWRNHRRNHSGRTDCCVRKAEELETDSRKVRVYDIQNAGRHHRFTVSGHLVHNCGYGGSVGALKAMGALDMGLKEEELQPIVDAWRAANPHITKFWWDVDRAVKEVIRTKEPREVRGIRFFYKNQMLFIHLPSGRDLAYVKPMLQPNQYGNESITYMGIGTTKKWERIESYGPKFVENITQAISRDILCYAMRTLSHCFICAHVHDELIIECSMDVSVDAVCEQMGRTPPWAPGLLLRADGYECEFYKKD